MESGNRDDILREVPMGFGFALIKNEDAMRRYSQLSESEKEEILMKCKDAKSKKECKKLWMNWCRIRILILCTKAPKLCKDKDICMPKRSAVRISLIFCEIFCVLALIVL